MRTVREQGISQFAGAARKKKQDPLENKCKQAEQNEGGEEGLKSDFC